MHGRAAEWSSDEIYVAMPRPGGDAWLRIDRASGDAEFEDTRRGWVSYLNDLHKGRNAGTAWSWFIDAFAVACLIFTLTGLAIAATVLTFGGWMVFQLIKGFADKEAPPLPGQDSTRRPDSENAAANPPPNPPPTV